MPVAVPALALDTSMRAFAARTMSFFLDQLSELLPLVLDTRTEESIHDARVATRRLRAALRVFRDELGGRDAVAPVNNELRWIAQTLGEVRDEDVFIIWARKLKIDAIEPLLEGHQRHRDAALAAFLDSAPRERLRLFLELARGMARMAEGLSSPRDTPMRKACPRALRRARRRVVEYHAELPPDPAVPQLHELRILFKRLRYTAEYFNPSYGGLLDPLIADATTMQDTLGGVTDRHNHLARLEGDLAHAPEPVDQTLRDAVALASERCRMQDSKLRQEFGFLWSHFDGDEGRLEMESLFARMERLR
ncbi:MAG: CHAD domain-containing protein [Candidatus Sumerlaeia bacterium]|nr:CHAD domain-containing protein [Candidatus Sumerlaeia bacterium]